MDCDDIKDHSLMPCTRETSKEKPKIRYFILILALKLNPEKIYGTELNLKNN